MLKTSLGDFELIHLTDGGYFLDGGVMFGVVPKPMWSKLMPADDLNRIRFSCNSLLVRTGEKTVLIETGIGPKLNDKMRSIFQNEARLLRSFEQAGLDPGEVDVVINTHLHFDHCGWNTYRKGDLILPTFPRAKYYVQRGEVAHARLQLERDRISYIGENYEPLIASGQMELLEGDRELLPGVAVHVYPGHTRHMQVVTVRSQGKTAAYVSDLISTTAHVHPTWVLAYDLFPLEVIQSRHRLYKEAIPEKWLIAFTHDPHVPWASVSRNEQGKYGFHAAGKAPAVLAR